MCPLMHCNLTDYGSQDILFFCTSTKIQFYCIISLFAGQSTLLQTFTVILLNLRAKPLTSECGAEWMYHSSLCVNHNTVTPLSASHPVLRLYFINPTIQSRTEHFLLYAFRLGRFTTLDNQTKRCSPKLTIHTDIRHNNALGRLAPPTTVCSLFCCFKN